MIDTVLTIAGSDSSGGAGIQADLKAIAANGGYGATVVTAITAQNTTGVARVEALSAALVRAQMDAVFDDLRVAAVKTGMLASEEIVRTVAEGLRARGPAHLVCDPVMISKSGHALLPAECVEALRTLVLPLADLVTPNVHEAEALSGMVAIRSVEDAERAGRRILELGARAVLVKGGHLAQAGATDVLVTRDGTRVFRGLWVETRHTHGTGCTFSAAIATWLARGASLVDAIEAAKEFVTEAIRAGLPVGRGTGPTDPFFFLRGSAEGERWLARLRGAGAPRRSEPGTLHVITDETLQSRFTHQDLARLAAGAGADAVQFREKRPWTTARLVATARAMREATASTRARVVVNDRVDVAAAASVPAVHLGKDDVDAATARRVLGREALLGATAHTLAEALEASREDVDYLGVGPVFGTSSKADARPPMGLAGLSEIARAVSKPVIAVGSITAERVGPVLEAGAAGVAVLSAVAGAQDPALATHRIREAIDRCAPGRTH